MSAWKIQVRFDDGSWSTIGPYESTLYPTEADARAEAEYGNERLAALLARGRVRFVDEGVSGEL